MDGDLSNLVDLIPRTGIDVVESFSPTPLSRLTFHKAWQAWRDKVVIWGGLPSPIFEPHVSAKQFERYVTQVLTTAANDGMLILGVADQAVRPTMWERIARVAELISECGVHQPAQGAQVDSVS